MKLKSVGADYLFVVLKTNCFGFYKVESVGDFLTTVYTKKLTKKYPKVKISKIVENDWGREFFVHDPSGTLW